jgi:hypothetical protein
MGVESHRQPWRRTERGARRPERPRRPGLLWIGWIDFGGFRVAGGGAVGSGVSIGRVTAAGSRRRPGELCGVMRPERLLPIGQVSGTVWQTGGRSMQEITTIIPVKQYGHWRNDILVRAWYRSR